MFLFIIFVVFIGNLVVSDKNFSEMENRTLVQKPKLSVKSIVSGEYTEQYEKYISDQVILKDNFMITKTIFNLLLGQKNQNGVTLIGKKLIQDFRYDKENFNKNISHINSFCNSLDVKCNFVAIPNAIGMINNEQRDIMNNLEVFGNVNYINLFETLFSHKNEYIYYNTDHHWTSLGAKYAYEKISTTPPTTSSNKKVDVEPIIVSNNFLGSLYSKMPLAKPQSHNERSEIINWQVPDSIIKYDMDKLVKKIYIAGTNVYSNSLYFKKNLKKKDQYLYFLDGNHALIKIDTKSDIDKKILILKDSYSNSLIQFFVQDYNQIEVLDLRYLNIDIKDYVKNNNFDEVFLIYNLDFLNNDTNFYKLTK